MLDQEKKRQEIYDNLVDTLVAHAPSNVLSGVGECTVLDFGCGPSNKAYIELYKDNFTKAYGVDVFDYSSQYQDDVTFILSDGLTVNLPDKTCDLIVSHSVLEHVSDVRASIAEIHRLLRINGIAYLTVAPLYYAPRGAHIPDLEDWGHLNPASEFYLLEQPIRRKGAHLNKLTMLKLSDAIFRVPWRVLHLETRTGAFSIPHFVPKDIPLHDLLIKEFRVILQRVR